MGLNGTILLFPKVGQPTASPEEIAKRAIEAFERRNIAVFHPTKQIFR
jgi:hypothetical protein